MIFNGIDLSSYLRIISIKGRWLTSYELSLMSVPGMAGSHLEGKSLPARVLEIECDINAENKEALTQKIDTLNGILSVDEPVPIILDGEPDKTYYGTPAEMSEGDFKFFKQGGTISIVCPDPYKYGFEKEEQFVDGLATITNNGTALSKPVFELNVLAPITFAMIQNQFGEYMMIGKPISLDDVATEPFTTVLRDTCDSTIGWTDGNDLVDGIRTGSIFSQDGKIRAQDYGVGPGWHGPVKKKSLSEPVQDFNLQVMIDFNEAIADNTGRLIVSLLDVNNNVVGMLSFFDLYTQWFDKVGRGEIGNNILVSDRGIDWSGYFVGRLVLQRKGQEITAKISQYDTYRKMFIDSIEGTFIDYLDQHQTPITQVQLHFGAYGEHTRPFMSVNDIHVRKINDTSNAIPYIANAGDVISFDMKQNLILINGEPKKDLKQFGASYFGLHPGNNQLSVLPNGALGVKAFYREPYK